MKYCIETQQLTYAYGRQIVLDEVSLQMPAGSIFGFLGPNGAGKTTTLRLLLGLLQPQAGSIQVLGRSLHTDRASILQHIGALIESPSVYGHLSATENLEIWQQIYRCQRSRINEVLQLTGLTATGNKKVRHFSLGMKQRLGIAVALLHNPSLLILDEPTNGLDPHGIIDIRQLLHQLNAQGMSILVSSHLLSEIDKICTHAAIIHHGKISFQGTMEALRNSGTNQDLESIFLQHVIV